MEMHTNIPLKNYVTMRLGGNARFMTDITTPDELAAAYKNAFAQNIPIFMLGGGSNIIVKDDGFSGLVVRNRIPGFEVLEDTASTTSIRIGAGELWDKVVERTVSMNLSGVEAMSAIPGTAGASPIQNVGAYGQEIADTLTSLEAYDTQTDQFVTLTNKDCGFSYRHSIFRGDSAGRYGIYSITLKLLKQAPTPPFYEALQKYLDENNITLYTPQTIRDAVINVRSSKLPDPNKLPNTGSFFKNAIIDNWQFEELQKRWPDMPSYPLDSKRVKIPTGWLIDQAKLKGKLLHGMRIHDKNALVLINESATNYRDLEAAIDDIQGAVRDTFGIIIEQEPLVMSD